MYLDVATTILLVILLKMTMRQLRAVLHKIAKYFTALTITLCISIITRMIIICIMCIYRTNYNIHDILIISSTLDLLVFIHSYM